MKKLLFSLRTVVISPLAIGFLLIILIILVIQTRAYDRAIEEESGKHLIGISKNAEAEIMSYFLSPLNVSLTASNSIQFLYNQTNDLNTIEEFFNFTVENVGHHIFQLDGVSFTSTGGKDFIAILRDQDTPNFNLLRKGDGTNGDLYIYDGLTTQDPVQEVIPNYRPEKLAWYMDINPIYKIRWTEPYVSYFDQLFIAAVSPIKKGNDVIGLLALHIRMEKIYSLLKRFNQSNQADIFIFDNNHNVIATSEPNELAIITEYANQYASKPERSEKAITYRKHMTLLENPVMNKAARQILSILESTDISTSLTNDVLYNRNFSFYIDDKRYFSYVTHFKNSYGLDWSIVTTLSEQKLVGDLPKRQKRELLIILISCLLGGILIYSILSRVTNRIQTSAKAVQELAKGNWDVKMPPHTRVAEIETLNSSFNNMANQLRRSFDDLKRQISHDPLTSLYTRQGFIDELQQKAQQSALIVFGVEKFRRINDSYGHDVANKLLVEIANKIKPCLPKNSLLSRIGGDDFAIYLPNVNEEFKIKDVTSKLDKAFKEPICVEDNFILVNKMIGACLLDENDSIEAGLRNANVALSYAKELPSRYAIYQHTMIDASLKRTETIAAIRQAIENNEFIPYYQPLIDLQTEKAIGAEALARWISPQKGLIPPYQFITIAEECGLIREIGNKILYQACLDTKTFIDSGRWHPDFHIHVNVSVNQLQLDSFTRDLEKIMAKTQLPAKNLTLEITESNIVDKTDTMIKNLNYIKELGISIAIDDFGTGYSSLAYLQDMAFDSLKIDRTFICELNEENAEGSIAASILAMTRNFKVPVVSEGIETEEQARIMKKLGSQMAQGYYYSRPLPLEQWPDELNPPS